MAKVADLLLEGLSEGLILRTVERGPAAPADLLDELTRLLGRPPDRKQVFPVLHRLEDHDRVRPTEATGGQGKVYQLTQAGARRLAAYRALPGPLEQITHELFDLPARQRGHDGQAATGIPSPPADPAEEGWVQACLAQLPAAPEVQAPFAWVSLDREPGSRVWTLSVEQHEPGGYEGAQACPLTFLYAAASRLLYGGRSPAEVQVVETER